MQMCNQMYNLYPVTWILDRIMNFQNSTENLSWGFVLAWDQVHEKDLKCAQVFWFTSVESEMR